MRTLTLLRHAKSSWDDPVLRDFDRPLNARGQRAAAVMGRHLHALGIGFDHVIASPAARVTETIDHFSTGYGARLEPAWDRRVYLASAATLLDLIHAAPADAERVLLVGHNPGLEDLVLLLVPPGGDDALRAAVAQKYPTASVAELRFEVGWPEVAPGSARLARFIRPRDLDPALGPEGG